MGELIDLAVEFGIVRKSGAWFSYESEKLGQGREAVKKALREDPELYAKIRQQVREVMSPALPAAEPQEA